jgi:uncharacterized membrane protein YdjX (TVP38/TMEM64 family)
MFSLTKVDHSTHFVASLCGLIPSSFVFIYAGAMGAEAAGGGFVQCMAHLRSFVASLAR